MATSPEDRSSTLRSFEAAWEDRDVDRIMEHFADSPTYHNIPLEPADGTDEVRAHIEEMLSAIEQIRFEVLHEVVSGDLVMNERIDTLTIGGTTRELPVMGVFEFEGDRIRHWRDYFDLAGFTG